jgi:MFS family permease
MPANKKSEKNVVKNVALLGSSSLFNDIGSEIITPILPFYVYALGGGGVAVGLLSGLRTGISSLIKVFSGYLSDRLGKRKIFIWIGYIISIIFKFILALSTSWQHIAVALSFERLGKLRDSPRDALISESVKKNRGRVFGLHRMFDTSGAVIGSLLVILLFWKLNLEFKTIIFIAAGISVLALIPLFFVKDAKVRKIRDGFFYSISKVDKRIRYLLATFSIFALADFGLYMFLVLRAQEVTGSILLSLGLYAIFNLFYAGFAIPFGKYSDRVGRKRVLVIGYCLFFVMSIGLAFSSSFYGLLLFFIIYGFVAAIVQTNQAAYVADLAKERGTALGLYHTVIGLVSIPAGLIAGYLWDISYLLMFVYAAGISFIALALMIFSKTRGKLKT